MSNHNVNIRITVDGVDIDPNPREVFRDPEFMEQQKQVKELQAKINAEAERMRNMPIDEFRKQGIAIGIGQHCPEEGTKQRDRSEIEVACGHLEEEVGGLGETIQQLQRILTPVLTEEQPETGCNTGETITVFCPLATELESYADRFGFLRSRLERLISRIRL